MLQLHRAERADRLVDALASLLADPLDDPLQPEVVSVPTRGVERWVTQRLAASLGASQGRGDGVCANVTFPFPGRLVGAATAAATGVERDADPWLPERSVWPLLEVVEDCLDQSWLAPLAGHLGTGAQPHDDHRRSRRFGVVRHLADLFDRYGVHRPGMVRAWADGHDSDGEGQALPADAVWQAQLWRCLRERLAAPSPAERLTEACRALREAPELVDLPSRLAVFGLTRLPASYLDVLRALAAVRDVHLLLLHPSAALWDRIAEQHTPLGADGDGSPPRRRDDPTARTPRNPLLATWAQDAREMQLVLTAGGADRPATRQVHHRLDADAGSLLRRVQADVRADRVPPGPPLAGEPDQRAELAADDRSVQVHACHGRARQVEVLRNAILQLLEHDPTLEPRDIVVMCPDIDAFAPLIHATFAAGDVDDDGESPPADARPADLRVRLADRSLRQTNPVLGVVAEVLDLAAARLTASQVVDFASRSPVRRRFGFSDDDLARIEEWVDAAGVRWGLDAAHRAPYKLEKVDANTWRAGLDRILLGVTMDEHPPRLVGGVLPLDDVASGDIDLAGRLAELVDRLHAAVDALGRSQPIAAWAETIAECADALTATGERDEWQRVQLQQLLDEVVDEASVDGTPSATPLERSEVVAVLADRLRGRPTRANFRTGHLTMCTLVPMRSVPHRVVCLLGLDDGVFPRKAVPDGDDLVHREPRVGDRDPRSEDRQLLLDALMAATDTVVITYSGRDERTNAELPPAVPVGELLDVVDATARPADPEGDEAPAARDHVVVQHPLQPFDPRNFTAGALRRDRPWSFDAVALEGAQAALGPRAAPPPFLPRRLPVSARDVVELDDLVAFVQHPVNAFLRQRLGIVLRDPDDEPDDALPIELSRLDEWHVGQRLLEARLAGADAPTATAAERARGTLPPGTLAAPVIAEVGRTVERIVPEALAVAAEDPDTEPASVDVHVDLPDGRTVTGTVAGCLGDVVRAVTYSRVAAKHRLAAWVRLLAATATHPHRPFEAVTIGRGQGQRVRRVRLPPLGEGAAARHHQAVRGLAALLDLHARGLREPLPLYCRTSNAWAEAHARGTNPAVAARKEWESTREWAREDAEREHQLVHGGTVTLAELLALEPREDESGDGWPDDEPTRLGRYARRLWDDVLAREEVAAR